MENSENTLVTIVNSNYIHEIQIAKTLLSDRGIKTYSIDENINSVYGATVGGYKLQISSLDFDEAKAILDEVNSDEA
jgi:hypothetical protein